MSARRKGKPQQRRKIETAEQEQQDFITCGDCQHEFKLSDIVKFIQHKVNGCNKENVDPFENNEGADDGSPEGSEPVSSLIGNRRTSISAPIAHRGTPELRGDKTSPRPSRELPSTTLDGTKAAVSNHSNNDDDDEDDSNEEGEDDVITTADASRRKKKCIMNSDGSQEPHTLRCVACQLTVASAWTLMQHAQHKHNISIYIDDNQVAPQPANAAETRVKQETESEDQSEAKNSKRDCDDNNDDKSEVKSSREQRTSGSQGQGHSSSRGETPQIFADSDRRRSTSSAATPPREAYAHSQRSTPHSSRSSNSSPPINMGDLMSTTPPFMFRMPHSAERQQLSPAGPLIPPFGSPPDFRSQADFRFGLPGMSPFQRMPGIPGFETIHPGMPSNPFERPIRPHINDTNPFSHEMYSLRLRHLASGNTANKSPEALLKPPLTPPFSHQSSFFATSPPDPLRAGMTLGSKPYLPSGKGKKCEFCGKDFKFLSNLIVHRRSHTGEKPFKCPLCPHACSQASKLKRHMKTHRSDKESSPTNGMATKLSKLVDYIGREEENGDDFDMDEEIAIEEARKFGLIDEIVDDVRIRSKSLTSPGNSDSDGSDLPADEDSVPVNGTSSNKESRTALLTEVMEKSGLGSIQQYSEAFSQALEESTGKDSKGSKSGSDRGSENGEKITQNGHSSHDDSDAQSVAESRKTSSSVTSNDMNDSEPSMNGDHHGSVSKRIKLDEGEHVMPPMHPFPLGHMWPNPFMPGPMGGHGGPPRHWPPGLGIHLPQGTGLRHENGFSGESAFSSSKGNGVLNHSTPVRSGRSEHERGRKDTCEYCGKFFKNASNLTVHRRTHTGEKPYQCRLCPYSCAQSSKLTRHMKIHGQGRHENGNERGAYHCKFCNMPFSVPGTLEKHMRKCVEKHHGGNPHAMAAALNPESPFSKPPSVASSETSNDSSNVA